MPDEQTAVRILSLNAGRENEYCRAEQCTDSDRASQGHKKTPDTNR